MSREFKIASIAILATLILFYTAMFLISIDRKDTAMKLICVWIIISVLIYTFNIMGGDTLIIGMDECLKGSNEKGLKGWSEELLFNIKFLILFPLFIIYVIIKQELEE